MTTLTNAKCRKYAQNAHLRNLFVHDGVVCAGHQALSGPFFYNFGSGLVSSTGERKLIGIQSWLIPLKIARLDGYTRIDYYFDWISQHTRVAYSGNVYEN